MRFARHKFHFFTAALILLASVLTVYAQDPTPTMPPLISFNPGAVDGTAYQWTVVANGFDIPVGLTYAPDGSGRVFVWQQNGMIWVVMPDGTVPFDPFIDISRLLNPIVFRGGYTEEGLLGMAFHPDYANNGWFYLNYTDRNGDTVIVRYTVSADDPNRANRDTALIILTQDQPYENHNGGHIAFGPDGYLYIGLGDGGLQGDPHNYAQNPGSLLGKMLRIQVTEDGYTAPPDNPFSTDPAYLPEVWAIGFRNPWRFSFDRLTGDLYIADVGEWLWEEIDVLPAGAGAGFNFGWPLFESSNPRTAITSIDGYFTPTIEYSHNEGCSVTGGHVYRGSELPEADGVYFFGDYCNGFIWTAQQQENGEWQVGLFQQTGRQITSFGEDEAGELYLIDYKGDVLRLERAG